MRVKIPGFELEISKIWAVIALIWSIGLVLATSYITFEINQAKIQDRMERTSKVVGGMDSRMQERVKVTDARFESLEKGQMQMQIDMTQIKGDLKTIQVSQDTYNASMTNQMDQVQRTLNSMASYFMDRSRNHPASYSAVYEVQ